MILFSYGTSEHSRVFPCRWSVIRQTDMAELMPIIRERKSLAELAHEESREKILFGYFKPGDWLRQADLSQPLAVSHTPVREALDRLVADGLAERVPHKGVRVPTIYENDMTSNPSSSIFPPPDDIVPKSGGFYSATYTSREKEEKRAKQIVDHIVEMAQRELYCDQKSTLQSGAKGETIEGEKIGHSVWPLMRSGIHYKL